MLLSDSSHCLLFIVVLAMGCSLAVLIVCYHCCFSYAALPVAVKCVETELEADPRIARLVLTMGAAVNMQGCALYYAVAAISVAQLRGVTLLFQDVALLRYIFYSVYSINFLTRSLSAAVQPFAAYRQTDVN